jgi:hypothetical protein
MRNLTTEEAPKATITRELETFSTTLSDGRTITIREMTGRDLIYYEEELTGQGDTRKSFHLIERLNVGSEQISFDEIQDLGIKDIKKISDLVAKANGTDEDEDSESPK